MTSKIVFFSLLAAASAPALAQAAANQPQPVPRTAFMQRIDSGFVSADANKDGFTDRNEIQSAQTKEMTARKAEALKMREAAFRKMDTDKNGQMSLQEFNAAVTATAIPKADATPVLSRLDTNKDGKISLAENRVPAMAQFDRADTNKDGTLSVQELRAGQPR